MLNISLQTRSDNQPSLQLKVKAEENEEGAKIPSEETKHRDRIYYSSGLKDLQSRLTLVSGKSKDKKFWTGGH